MWASVPAVVALRLRSAVRSDVGRRRANNEDAVFASERIAAVADGVGGAAAGEVASRTVINALHQLDKTRIAGRVDEALSRAIARGNDTIAFIAACRPETAGMGTTLTTVAIGDEGDYVLANVGDSRTYLLRDGALRRLTRDDGVGSLLFAALDGDPGRTAPTEHVEARAGDRLLLCSDGLSDLVDDDAIAVTLRDEPDREACADRLVAAALEAGGRDNVSVVVADVSQA